MYVRVRPLIVHITPLVAVDARWCTAQLINFCEKGSSSSGHGLPSLPKRCTEAPLTRGVMMDLYALLYQHSAASTVYLHRASTRAKAGLANNSPLSMGMYISFSLLPRTVIYDDRANDIYVFGRSHPTGEYLSINLSDVRIGLGSPVSRLDRRQATGSPSFRAQSLLLGRTVSLLNDCS